MQKVVKQYREEEDSYYDPDEHNDHTPASSQRKQTDQSDDAESLKQPKIVVKKGKK